MNKTQKITLIITLAVLIVSLAVFFVFNNFNSEKQTGNPGTKFDKLDYCEIDFKGFQDSLGIPEGAVSNKRQVDKIEANYNQVVKPIFAPGPEKAARNFAQALEDGKIKKALRQIYFDPVQKGENWNQYRSWVCEKKREELSSFASYIKKGELGEKTGEFTRQWIVKILINQEEKEAPVGLIKVKDKGWQIDYL